MLKASVQRRYKDKDGEWKSSQSFSRNEIPLAIYCLQKSFEKIIEGQKDEITRLVEQRSELVLTCLQLTAERDALREALLDIQGKINFSSCGYCKEVYRLSRSALGNPNG